MEPREVCRVFRCRTSTSASPKFLGKVERRAGLYMILHALLSGYLFLYFFFVSLFLCVILVSVFLIFPVFFTVSLSLFPPMCSATWSVSEPNELRQPCEAPLRRHGPGPCWQCRCSRPSRALPSGQLGRHCSTRANRQPQHWIAC